MNVIPLISTASVWSQLGHDLRRYIRRRVSSDHITDDLLQETFVRVHRGLGDLEHAERVSAWVYQIARNVLNDHYRRAVPEATPLSDEPAVAENTKADECRWLGELVQQLPEPYREAIQLAEIDGLIQQEVADSAGLSLSGAKSRIQRGRVMLRELLDRCCAFEFDARGNLLDYVPHPRQTVCRQCND